MKRLYIRFKSLVNDSVYRFGRAALLLLVEVYNHTVPVRERGRIRVNQFLEKSALQKTGVWRICITRSFAKYYWSDRINKRLVVNVACFIFRNFKILGKKLENKDHFLRLRYMYRLAFGIILT